MQRKLDKAFRSDDEIIKDAGLILDFDEIVRKGSMTREEMVIAKWYGIYHSRQAGNHMARVVIPGGDMTSVQARALARLSAKYAPNRISFTTRQSAQFHCLRLEDLPQFLRDLQHAGMTTFHGCGDVTRNVAACPWASICPHRRMDVLPYAQETARLLAESRDLDNLPRKFKVTFSGCMGGCGQPYINCVGVVAKVRNFGDTLLNSVPESERDFRPQTELSKVPPKFQETGFHVNIGGGMGWQPFVAQTLYTFVPAEQITMTCRAVGRLFRDHGDRYIRMFARLKFVVHRQGIDKCRELVNGYLDEEGVDRSRFEVEPYEDSGPPIPERPMRAPRPVDSEGFSIARIMVPKGEIGSEQLARIADLSEIYGDKHVHSTNRQNLEIHGVRPERLAALNTEVAALGLLTEGFYGLRDIVACVGTTYCPLAVSNTHAMLEALQGVVHDDRYASIRDKAIIHISGCPNSCAQYRIADIGMRGTRIREAQGSIEGYQITLGGTETRFGELLGHYKFDDCLRVVRAVLDVFLAAINGDRHLLLRAPSENPTEGAAIIGACHHLLASHVQRVGMEPYRRAVEALGINYDMAVNPLELSVFTGEGETRLDRKTIARDVPCQEACPAKTNVPEYIRHIAHGNHGAAHLINQEDNVFPGALGRICTRPCEDRCRYQWTSTRGAVRICHLKRAASERKEGQSRPLPPWYESTGKRVAVAGGGPAGLAAARELKRFGHAVTVLERSNQLGGQIRAIPEFRLPRAVVDEDVNAIVASGIEVRFGERVDAARLTGLCNTHDAVLIATGANKPHSIKLDGLPEGMAVEGLHFMTKFNAGEPAPVAGNVIVIGGGFTAVDCARAARRMLPPECGVSILYRRGEAQMAANVEELHELRAERVRVETLVMPIAARVEGGKLRSVTFRRTLLGEPDASGKPNFIPIDGSDFEAPSETLILAIGQSPEMDIIPDGVSLRGRSGMIPDPPNLFTAGDFASGNGDVIHAVADGKAVAGLIDEYLMGRKRRKTYLHIQEGALTGRTRDHDLVYPPEVPMLPLDLRDETTEVELGYDADDAGVHAWRCYLCNHRFEIDQDKCIHCDWCIRVSPRNCILRLDRLERDEDGAPVSWHETPKSDPEKATYIWIDADQCIRCGNCINICPTSAISLRKCDLKTENCAG